MNEEPKTAGLPLGNLTSRALHSHPSAMPSVCPVPEHPTHAVKPTVASLCNDGSTTITMCVSRINRVVRCGAGEVQRHRHRRHRRADVAPSSCLRMKPGTRVDSRTPEANMPTQTPSITK